MYLFSDTIVRTFPEAVFEEFLPSIAVKGIVVVHQTRKRWSRRSNGDPVTHSEGQANATMRTTATN